MEQVRYIRPFRGVDVPGDPMAEDFPERKVELAGLIRHAIGDGPIVKNVDASSVTEIAAALLGDDDTAYPRGPVMLQDHGDIFEVILDESTERCLSDGTLMPAEPIVMPLHATSVLFCARHDRSDAWYCTTIITCEDEGLKNGESERPFFVWIEH